MKHLLVPMSLAALVSGCASPNGEFSWVTHTWAANQRVYALDHVSRNRVETALAVQRPYLGETYYFENESHAKTFDANPWAFLYSDNVADGGRPYRTDQN